MPDDAPIAFISYDTEVDKNTNRVTTLRQNLETELRIRLTRETWIFQDKESIRQGQAWQDRIRESLERAKILIPIVTPSLLQRPECLKELKAFKDRESRTGLRPPVLPILFLDTDGISIADRTSGAERSDPKTRELVTWLSSYQYANWTELRNRLTADADYLTEISRLADRLVEMASKADRAPETRERPEIPETPGTPETEPETRTKTRMRTEKQPDKPKRWLVPALAAVVAVAVLSASWVLVDSCRSAAEPSGICRIFIDEPAPQLVPLDGPLEVFADEPVAARAAPDAEADVVEELVKGYRFDTLWEVDDTEWYAFERGDGEKAYFRGDVLRPVEEPPPPEPPTFVKIDGQFYISVKEPVVARAAPSADARLIEELARGDILETLWKVENTDWYAYDSSDGERAYFRGNVFRPVNAP